MALQANGTIKMSEINTELGRTSSATISLDSAESGTYATINTASSSYPNNARPASMSEWYSYNHSSSSADFFALINSGTSNSGASCASSGADNLTLYHGTGGANVCPVVTTTVYSDNAKTNAFNGGGNWWHSPTCGAAYNITVNGVIDSVVSCVESGNISDDGQSVMRDACGLEVVDLVYKSGSSATPSAGETLWSDSQLNSAYSPSAGLDLWYTYQIAGTTTQYAIFLTDNNGDTYIEGVNSCA